MLKYKEITKRAAARLGISKDECRGGRRSFLVGDTWIVSFDKVLDVPAAWVSFNTIEEEVNSDEFDTTVNLFTPSQILELLRTVMRIAQEQGYLLLQNIPACPKRARVYKLAAKRAGCDVFEQILEDGEIFQEIFAPGYTKGPTV